MTSYQELNLKYEADVLAVRQQAETLQFELDGKIKCHADKVAQDQHQ